MRVKVDIRYVRTGSILNNENTSVRTRTLISPSLYMKTCNNNNCK